MAAGHPGPRHCIVWSRGLRGGGERWVCESLARGGGRGLELSIGIVFVFFVFFPFLLNPLQGNPLVFQTKNILFYNLVVILNFDTWICLLQL